MSDARELSCVPKKKEAGRFLKGSPWPWMSLIKAQMMDPLALGRVLWVIVQSFWLWVQSP